VKAVMRDSVPEIWIFLDQMGDYQLLSENSVIFIAEEVPPHD
jgi:hypothetical protein